MSGPVFDHDVHEDGRADADVLDVGRDRRRPWPAARRPLNPRRRRIVTITAGVVVVGAAVTVAVVQSAGGRDGRNAGQNLSSPPVATTTVPGNGDVNGGGPQLVVVNGHAQLAVLGGGPFGSSPQYTDLEPAPTVISAIQDLLPGFELSLGGRVADPAVHYGIFITGHFQNAAGVSATLTVYSTRAPGTTPGNNQLVTRIREDNRPITRTEVSMFTGTGWWVHMLSEAEITGAGSVAEAPTLLALAADQRITS